MSVGMPQDVLLHEFGSQVWFAFGHVPYHVGSSLKNKSDWRDVDVRVLLPDEEWDALGFGDPDRTHHNGKWVALTLAFCALGKQMTGLPIDFQIQKQSWANEKFSQVDGHPRSALGVIPLRIKELA